MCGLVLEEGVLFAGAPSHLRSFRGVPYHFFFLKIFIALALTSMSVVYFELIFALCEIIV